MIQTKLKQDYNY